MNCLMEGHYCNGEKVPILFTHTVENEYVGKLGFLCELHLTWYSQQRYVTILKSRKEEGERGTIK